MLGAAVLWSAPAALAGGPGNLPPGVHVDPGSPAAKEYAIPLGQARGGAPLSGGAQLFGSGITNVAASTSSETSTSSSVSVSAAAGEPAGRRPVRHKRAGSGPAVTTHPQPAPQPVTGEQVAARAGPAAIGWMVGIAALVLLLGALGGSALTLRARRTGARAG